MRVRLLQSVPEPFFELLQETCDDGGYVAPGRQDSSSDIVQALGGGYPAEPSLDRVAHLLAEIALPLPSHF